MSEAAAPYHVALQGVADRTPWLQDHQDSTVAWQHMTGAIHVWWLSLTEEQRHNLAGFSMTFPLDGGAATFTLQYRPEQGAHGKAVADATYQHLSATGNQGVPNAPSE